MDQRDEKVFRCFDQNRHLAQQINLKHGGQDPHQNNIPYFHKPACYLADHADGSSLVPTKDSCFRDNYSGYIVVVVVDVLEVGQVAEELDNSQNTTEDKAEPDNQLPEGDAGVFAGNLHRASSNKVFYLVYIDGTNCKLQLHQIVSAFIQVKA